MKIACLGWGSLIWDPRELPMRGTWFEDGPLLPIEFARESADKGITLVIGEVELTVRSLWTLLSVASLDEARRKLAEREKIAKNIEHFVGFWENATDTSQWKGRTAGTCLGKAPGSGCRRLDKFAVWVQRQARRNAQIQAGFGAY